MSLVVYDTDSYTAILTDVYKTFYFLSNLRKIKIDYSYINPNHHIFKSGIISNCSYASFDSPNNSAISDLLKNILEPDNVALLLSDNILEYIMFLLLYIHDLVTNEDIKTLFDNEIKQKNLVKYILLSNYDILNYLLTIFELFNFIKIIKIDLCPTLFTDTWNYFNDDCTKLLFNDNIDFCIDIFDESKFNLDKMNENLKLLYDFLTDCLNTKDDVHIDKLLKELDVAEEIFGGKKILKIKKKLIKKLKKYIK